jgi:hypothetical protein
MGGEAAQKRKPEEQKPIKPPETQEKESRFVRIVKTAAKIAVFIALTPVALVTGCSSPYEEAPKPKTEPPVPSAPKKEIPTPPKAEDLYWWPGFIVKGDETIDVSVGFLPDRRISDKKFSFNEIPQKMRDDGRKVLQDGLDFSKFFFKKDVYSTILANNVFTPKESPSGYIDDVNGLRLATISGQNIATCFDGCKEYAQRVAFGPMHGRVMLHELLHDVWGTYMPEDDRMAYSTNARVFFNIYGKSWQADELIGSIWLAVYRTPSKPEEFTPLGFEGKLKGPELDDWATQALAGRMSDGQINRLKQAIRAYFEIREEIAFDRTYKMSDKDRDGEISGHSFMYMGSYQDIMNEAYAGQSLTSTRAIPAFISPSYKKIMKGDLVDALTNDGNGYFASQESFIEFSRYAESFIDWMKNKYPELNEVGK